MADIIVIGAGIGGLTAALSLAKSGRSVEVLERSTEPKEAGAGLQLSPNATLVLESLGLLDSTLAVAVKPRSLQVRSWQTGKLISETVVNEDGDEHPYLHIHRADLHDLLLRAVEVHPDIQIHLGQEVLKIQESEGSVSIVTSAGDRFTAEILVGADGIRSVANRLFFTDSAPQFTGQVAWRSVISADHLAPEQLKPIGKVWWGPGQHLVHYPVRRGEWLNCICVIEDRWREEVWTAPGDPTELAERFSNWHPEVRDLLGRIQPEHCFRWALYARRPMKTWCHGRLVLLGDACHATLPFLAQGAAMAIEDAACLALCLTELEPLSAFALYEKLRLPRTAAIQKQSGNNGKIFHMRGPLTWARDRVTPRLSGTVLKEVYSYDVLAETRRALGSSAS